MLDNLMSGLKLDITKKAEASKDQQEFANKLRQLEGKSDAQKVIMLKQFINEQNLRNRKMITKQLRMRKDTENTLKLIEEAKLVQPAPKVKKQEQEPDLVSEFKSLVSRSAFKPSAPPKQKLAMSGALAGKNKQEISICACGNLNPEHRGYCTECVKKLKARYDQLLDDLSEL